MTNERTWQEYVELAEHYKAIGLTDISLWRDSKEQVDGLWPFVVSGSSGGSHRLDMDTTYRFRAEHPCGIAFRWSLEIEDRDANGKGHYQIRVKEISDTVQRLPEPARTEFLVYLRICAEKVAAKADEWERITRRQRSDAEILWELCGGKEIR